MRLPARPAVLPTPIRGPCRVRALLPLVFGLGLGAAALPASAEDAGALAIEAPRLPGRAEAASHFYLDDHGLYVSTTGAEIEHPLGGRLALKLRALADWIGIYPPADFAEEHGHHLPGGHDHDPGGNPDAGPGGVDAVSAASARQGSGGGSQEVRGELGAGLVRRSRPGGNPLRISGETRASYEPDYQSASALGAFSLETFRGNSTVSGHAGATFDRIDPDPALASAGESWPAFQLKTQAGAAWSQVVTPRWVVSGGVSGAWLQGRLTSPYRRAQVVTTLFPERLPADRIRATAFVQGSCYLGWGMALHSRQGGYLDSWRVKAWIPETALAVELGPRFLLTLKHRSYVQRPAEFSRTAYGPADRLRTGDVRLGGLEEHGGGFELDWRIPRGSAGPLVLSAGYAYAYQEYWSLPGHDLRSHVFRLGATREY